MLTTVLGIVSHSRTGETQLDIQYGTSMLNSTVAVGTIYRSDAFISLDTFSDIINGEFAIVVPAS